MPLKKLTMMAIKDLQAKTSHTLTIDDLDIIMELDAIASSLSGTTQDERRILQQPYSLCGVSFYPLTIAKSQWFGEIVEEWGVRESQHEALLFWVMSLPNRSEALDEYADPNKAKKAIKALNKKLHCTPEQMAEVYRKCIGASANRQNENASADPQEQESDTDLYGGLIAALIKEYGGTYERWLYETPVDVVGMMFSHACARAEERDEQRRKDSSQKGKACAPRNSERIAMHARFRRKLAEIREKWSADDGQKES